VHNFQVAAYLVTMDTEQVLVFAFEFVSMFHDEANAPF
jgi:hypothetical protein